MADLTLSEDRRSVLLEAIYELDKLSRVLPGLVPLDHHQTHYAVKGISGRMIRLTSALLSGIDDEVVTDKYLQDIVNFEQIAEG